MIAKQIAIDEATDDVPSTYTVSKLSSKTHLFLPVGMSIVCAASLSIVNNPAAFS